MECVSQHSTAKGKMRYCLADFEFCAMRDFKKSCLFEKETTTRAFFFLDKSHLSGRFLSFPDKSSQFPDKSSPSGIRTALNFC